MYKLLALIAAGLFVFCTQLSAQSEKQVVFLSGKDNNHTATWDFYCTGGRKSGYWSTIEVPSCWEQQGYGSYNYGRDYKTYGKNFRFADEKGMYRHKFSAPASWKNKTVKLVFEGSMTDTEVMINGKKAGETHQGSFYRFSYDITSLLDYSKQNQLAITVSKMSADPSVNNAERLADYWIFGGIFRPVYLEITPREYISSANIDAKADGSFAVNTYLERATGSSQLKAAILDKSGKQLSSQTVAVKAGDSMVSFKGKVNAPKTWTSETPNLYKLQLTLESNGKILYRHRENFGFRTIEVRRGDGIYINGVQVKMKGINRHSWWPETGRTLNDSIQLADVRLIKEMNMNAVRMSHYPPDKRFLELCDSLGLYVLDELAGWQKAYATPVGEKIVREMVIRDRNHPSIIFWDNGNEGGTNKELDDDFLKYDLSQRPVIHPHHRPGNAFSGIDCNHYEDYYSTKQILSDSLIYMPTEFLHCQDDGGGGTALYDFWELHWKSKRSGGGFLWALLDEGIVRTDLNNIIDVNGVNAPDGVLGPHREKEGSFYSIREIFSPVIIKLKQLPAEFNGDIAIENRYHFTNLSACSFRYELVNYRKAGERFQGYVSAGKGSITSPDVAPTDSGKLHLTLPADYKNSDGLLVYAYDPFKQLIYKWSIKTGKTESWPGALITAGKQAVEPTETDSVLTLKAGGISVAFSKITGLITDVKGNSGDKLSFGNGPVLVSGDSRFLKLTHAKEADGITVTVSYEGALREVRWKMHNSGWLELDYEMQLTGNYLFSGISFNYPENFVLSAKWLGEGPYRVWKNRLQGTTRNVWENAYNNTQTGSSPWIFPEFKGYYADISWMEINTVEGKFIVASPEKGLFVRLFDFYGLSGVKPNPTLPTGNLSFLESIPPLGTKLALNIDSNTPKLGPTSELNHLAGPTKRKLLFYFGTLQTDEKAQPYTVPAKDELF